VGGADLVAQRPDGVDHAVGPADVEAEEVLDLREGDHDGGGRGEAADHRVRQQGDQAPEAGDAQAHEHGAHHEREEGGGADVGGVAGLGDRGEARQGQQRGDGHRPDGERAAGAEHGVGGDAHDGGVQAGDRGHAGEAGVGHALGDEHDRHRQAGDDVVAQPLTRVAGAPRQDGDPSAQRAPGCPPGGPGGSGGWAAGGAGPGGGRRPRDHGAHRPVVSWLTTVPTSHVAAPRL
jgi:hypothetical protein